MGKSEEAVFFELALEDLRRAADLFRPMHERTNGVDGWVSLEVSPLLAYYTARTLEAAKDLHARAARLNLLIKIPGTKEGLPAIEEAIFAGIPINVTLLFSSRQYLAAADAFLRGIERRIEAGLKSDVGSVASVFVSRWDGDPPDGAPEVILIASGSEVSLAIEAHEKLVAQGIRSRVVSMPSWEIFGHQREDYRDSVLPPEVRARVAVERASTFGWERYTGLEGRTIGMKTFGASAPLKEPQKKFGFEPNLVVQAAKQLLGKG